MYIGDLSEVPIHASVGYFLNANLLSCFDILLPEEWIILELRFILWSKTGHDFKTCTLTVQWLQTTRYCLILIWNLTLAEL
jgi:hypothetical protein